ncbi:MAG: hypothetical protein JXR83_18395 [Deltaproteobacteria bacterium]|nr:hypothetical protein [Deltaproteobacteria bacterium]
MNTFMLVTVLVAAKPGASFDAIKQSAEGLESPSQAISAIVGKCDEQDPEMQIKCLDNLKKSGEQHKGKRYYLDLGSGHQELLEFEGIHGGKARFLWVPMYDPGTGQPLTAQKPAKLNASGWPVLQKKVIDGKLPAGTSAGDLQRLARLGQVNIELVGKFDKAWELGGRDQKVRGVVFKIEGLRLAQARTGETLLEIVY